VLDTFLQNLQTQLTLLTLRTRPVHSWPSTTELPPAQQHVWGLIDRLWIPLSRKQLVRRKPAELGLLWAKKSLTKRFDRALPVMLVT